MTLATLLLVPDDAGDADAAGKADDEGGADVGGVAEGLLDGASDALGTIEGDGVRAGTEGGSWLGALALGTMSATPARIAIAANTPVTNPSRIERRLATRRRVPVREGAGPVCRVAARLVVRWGVSSSCFGRG